MTCRSMPTPMAVAKPELLAGRIALWGGIGRMLGVARGVAAKANEFVLGKNVGRNEGHKHKNKKHSSKPEHGIPSKSHSARRARIGSVRVARQAGKKHAAVDATVITANAAAKASGSRGLS